MLLHNYLNNIFILNIFSWLFVYSFQLITNKLKASALQKTQKLLILILRKTGLRRKLKCIFSIKWSYFLYNNDETCLASDSCYQLILSHDINTVSTRLNLVTVISTFTISLCNYSLQVLLKMIATLLYYPHFGIHKQQCLES